jgi:hypothetical protein
MRDSTTMRALAGELLLVAWEEGAPEHDLGRALTLLSIALPDADREQLGALPIAQRNLLLLCLHGLTFGPLLNVFGVCPKCAEQFEFAVPAAEMAARLEGQSPGSRMAWREAGRQYRLRAVTTDDLLATLGVPEAAAAQDLLLAGCLEVSPAEPGEPGEPGGSTALAAVLPRFEQLNAAAELRCWIECPGCSARELLDLDVARFLWMEVRNGARRLLGEIHELASAYGWSERDIVGMGAGRRAAYLEMLGA